MHSFEKNLKSGILILVILMWTVQVYAQDPIVRPWDADPRAYIQARAVQASVDQTLIQDSLNREKSIQSSLEKQLAHTVQAVKISELRAELRQSKLRIKALQAKLTDKIILGKTYKKMSSLSDQEIKHRLKATNGLRPELITKSDSLAKANPNQSKMPPTLSQDKSMDIKPKPGVVALPEKVVSQPFEPWTENAYADLIVKSNCEFQDNTGGISRKPGSALRPEVLFRYTPEEIKKYLRGQSYLTGEAFIATEPGFIYLQLRLDIASDQALRHYGNLEKSILVVSFVNGKEIKLINSRYDPGYVDNVKKTTTMTGVYYLEKPMIKMLSSSEADKIRLNFSTGYEDYVIYNIDFFTRQLACINASK